MIVNSTRKIFAILLVPGRRGVNKAIKDTLYMSLKNFIYLNNGITLDGNAVKPKGNIRGHTGNRKHIAVDGHLSLTVHKPSPVLRFYA